MKLNFSKLLSKTGIGIILSVIMLLSFAETFSQSYCIPFPTTKWGVCNPTYAYCYAQYARIYQVTITGPEGTVLDNSTGYTCYTYYEDPNPELIPGNTYTVSVRTYKYYYNYSRLFIDWDKNYIFKYKD